MITLEVFGDNEHFTTIQADGVRSNKKLIACYGISANA